LHFVAGRARLLRAFSTGRGIQRVMESRLRATGAQSPSQDVDPHLPPVSSASGGIAAARRGIIGPAPAPERVNALREAEPTQSAVETLSIL